MIMNRSVIIDVQPEYIRAAVTEDGKLCELMLEKQNDDDQTESIFLGRIQSIRKSIHAAFVDIGMQQNAFLPLDETRTLRCGEMLLVQGAAKQATDSKGLRVTDKINLAGKWLVLIPERSGIHISKKIKDPVLRDELAACGRRICPPDCGLIIRTVSEEATEDLLRQETESLYERWRCIRKKSDGMLQPGIIIQRERLDMRLVRDLRDVSQIVVNCNSAYAALTHAQESQHIGNETAIRLHSEDAQLIFDAYSIEPQIDKALKKRIWLPCGGYLVFDHCEALTVIDVNSGKMTLGHDLEDTALRVNLEAADEIARQLRLRDIGGIIVVDFIDMRSAEHRELLLNKVKEAIKKDRTQVSVEGITRLGLLEMTRKRVHTTLHKALRNSCSYCSGGGEVLSSDEVARRALRQVRRMVISGQRGPFLIRCAASVVQALAVMKAPESCVVYACTAPGRHAEKYDIEQLGAGIGAPKDATALK